MALQLRIADLNDAEDVSTLFQAAYGTLMAGAYDEAVLARALPLMARANAQLLSSGTFYLVQDDGVLAGCGGWTLQAPGAQNTQSGLAHLRHFATHPQHTRKGVGRMIFEHCAVEAKAASASLFQAFSSLNAEPFYQSVGLKRISEIDLAMGPAVKLPVVLMEGAA
jgi:N-acetylglutamate synthase-like GNAT family acetyltransferase